MRIELNLNKDSLKAATQSWNTLSNTKNKNKNYCINPSTEEYRKLDKYTPQLQINSKVWVLLEKAVKALNEVIDKIYMSSSLQGVVSYKTVCTSIKKELEAEITRREQDSNNKREFQKILESIQKAIESEVDYSEFYFVLEGLELEDLTEINCGKAEIFIFNEEVRDQLITLYFGEDKPDFQRLQRIQEFFDENFLNYLCIKSKAYGDDEMSRRNAYKQARELINYFRYILCLLFHNRIAEQMVRINLLYEAYNNNERLLIKSKKHDTVSLGYSRGRRPLQSFSINPSRLQDMFSNGFMSDFIEIINASSQTQVEGCILTAIYWIGEAQNEPDLDVAFLKYWTALECMFSEKEDTTKSLAKGVTTINAFSSYDFISVGDAKKVYKDIVKLYDKRSDIIHRGMNYLANQVINEVDVSEICKYAAWSVLSLFHLRSIDYTTMNQVKSWINVQCKIWNI